MRSLLTAARAASIWILLLPPFVTFLGAASNQLVLIANHDKFPVMWNAKVAATEEVGPDGMIDSRHCLMTPQTRLNALGDIFDLHTEWISIGDMFLRLGAWLQSFCPFVWGAIVIRKLYKVRYADVVANPR